MFHGLATLAVEDIEAREGDEMDETSEGRRSDVSF